MKTNIKTETQVAAAAINSALKDKSQRLGQMESKLLFILDEAENHEEIRKAMPKCNDFFDLLTSDEVVSLLNTTESKAVRIALWYHYGETIALAA